jgi:hypothetical protein
MTIRGMHAQFDLESDRISSGALLDFNAREKDDYLNKAIWLFIKQHYDPDKKPPSGGFETKQFNIDALRSIVAKFPDQPALNVVSTTNSQVFELPLSLLKYEYLHLIRGQVSIVKNNCKKLVPFDLLEHDDDYTTYNKPSYKWNRIIARFGMSSQSPSTTLNPQKGSIYFETGGDFDIENVRTEYLRYPNKVFFGGYNEINGIYTTLSPPVNCDIDSAFHQEIVSIAVREALRDTQNTNSYQLKDIETKENL